MSIRSRTGASLLLASLLLVGVATTLPTAAETTAAPPAQAGFPRTEPTVMEFSSTSVIDLDRNGDLEILTADANGYVWAWEHNGTLRTGFPLDTKRSACTSRQRINGPLAIGNIVGNDNLEIVAGTRGCGGASGQRGQTYAWTATGGALSGWPKESDTNAYQTGSVEVTSVALGNLTGNALLEVVATTDNSAGHIPDTSTVDTRNLYAWTGAGTILPGFPTWYKTAGIWGASAVGNVQGDTYAEIVTGRDQLYMHIYNNQGQWLPSGQPIRMPLNIADANAQWGTYRYAEFTRSAAVLGDIDNDGVVEIIVQGKVRDPQQGHAVTGNTVFVMHADGTRQPGWEIAPQVGNKPTSTFEPLASVSLADVNGDGLLEIIVPFADGYVRVYKPNGQLLWSYNYAQGKILFPSEAAVGDISGDGRPDVIFGTYAPTSSNTADVRLIALNGTNGQLLTNFPLTLPQESGSKRGVRGAPTLADLDGDCDVEILVSSWGGTLYAWDLPARYYPNLMPWPTARHDNLRSGTAVGPALFTSACALYGATPTPTPTVLPTATATVPPTATPTAVPPVTATPAPSPTPPPPGSCEVVLNPTADAYIQGGTAANNNYGMTMDLAVKAGGTNYVREAYLGFDLTSVGASSASQARLELWVASTQNNAAVPLTAFAANNDNWTETGLTWATQPGRAAALGSGTAVAGQWVVLDVTAAINAELAGDKISTLVVWDTANTNLLATLHSRQAPHSPPRLVVVKSNCGPTATPLVSINFQGAGAAVPTGFMADEGHPFADRGNGFSYGWLAANNNGRDRNAANAPDQAYDTLNHMQVGGNQTWEMAVANGTYQVRVVAGDPSYFNSVYHLQVEGQDVVNGTPTAAQMWLEGTVTVTVTDGRLTLTNGASATNGKVTLITISTVP